MKTFARFTLLALILSSSAGALDYRFFLDGVHTDLSTVEEGGKVFVEANRFGKYLGPILDRVIDVNALVGSVTSKVDLGPLNGLFGGLLNRAASDVKYEVIRRAEEPYVDVQAFARGQGAQLVFHPFDKTFVIARDAAGLQRGEEARFVALGEVTVKLEEARLQNGRLALRFTTRGEREEDVRAWSFVGNGKVLSSEVTLVQAGRVDVTLSLADGAIPEELGVHGANGERVAYSLSSLR
ncbi:hypothetical protein [Deinococcus yavapaiensis]|uniref:Uncharacterized protein n=1 Tax=Deinococcus yavapaiensis KR-236 TaxID=694435 RepID=A0A318SDI1_9DEIO|nr:hypothetical protein [Deinococcus yavapaiensis]PYE55434.1 hypothetical protein DES52_103267 [Deinococcus yavapaiensis KR-236]